MPRSLPGEGIVFSERVNQIQDLLDDDELAAEEALAQGGIPGYCSDRYFRAASGGQYCDKFDGRRGR